MKPIKGCGYVVGDVGRVKIDNPNVLYHAFHNHGSGETFSFSDIWKFAQNGDMLSLTAVGNTGSKFVIARTYKSNDDAYKIFLNNKAKEVIYSANGTDFTYQMINDIQHGKMNRTVIQTLSKKQTTNLMKAILKQSIECAKGGGIYGFKYIFSTT